MHIIRQVENHPFPPFSFDRQQVESLTEKVNFLLEFLEEYSTPVADSDEADPLEMHIADAAEDIIESNIVDRILHAGPDDLYEDLQMVIEDMDLIRKEVMEIVAEKAVVQDRLQRAVSASAGSSRSSLTRLNNTMVGFEDVMLQLLDKLTAGRLDRQVIPIVGMGGIGKTTLARNIYAQPLIKEHFDICIWATISQDYSILETLREVLSQARGDSRFKSQNDLGEELHKHLWGRRYLIIMDDMWSIEVWEKMNLFFPNCENGSRILVTTRLSNLAAHLTDSNSIEMSFLEEASGWNLFPITVFGEECCPLEFEEMGKKIVENCNGLPLSIVVIGSLMARSQHTQEHWHHVQKNLSSMVNSENDQYCLNIAIFIIL